ncbi:FAD-dependent monooxygenase [Roseovarius aestuariivivens]|uniref:FAD-dependent monooxygenase n=1 Tax=Roseovarius aestuariivivens TaxID=1888910 RepID=UPI0010807C82|nr:FAD-dependent monooxygenase [Roseovarius aestuariivivens]
MDIKGLECLILGGGIGGLAAALALSARGARCRVLEQAPALREVGAGLQISPNGFVVLEALGLGEGLRQASVQAKAVRLCDYSGRDVVRLDLDQLERPWYFFVHRAELLSLLVEATARMGIPIETGRRILKVRSGARPSVEDQTGAVHAADLIIAADGLHSVARPVLNGEATPFFTGQVAWRAVIDSDSTAPEAQVFMGPKRHLVTYPLSRGRRNIVAVEERRSWQAESWSQTDDAENLRKAFADFGAPVRDMLARVGPVNLWGLFRHPVARTWHADGVALVGDAAHPTLPFLAQGANMALEDAWGLRRALDDASSLTGGLVAYQELRQARAERIVSAASRNAWKYHLSFPPLRMAAHFALRLGGSVAPRRLTGQFDWLYGYDITHD